MQKRSFYQDKLGTHIPIGEYCFAPPGLSLTANQVRKRHFLSTCNIKMLILPRHARDKHRKNSKKCRFLAEFDPARGAKTQNAFLSFAMPYSIKVGFCRFCCCSWFMTSTRCSTVRVVFRPSSLFHAPPPLWS